MNKFYGNHRRFLLRFEEEQEILNQFKDPATDIERSFFQYECQKKVYMNWQLLMLFNLCSVIAFVPTLIYLFIIGLFIKKEGKQKIIFALPLDKELVPIALMKELDDIKVLNRKNGRLTIADLIFLFKIIKKYPYAPFFCYKCAILIASYSYGIYKYQPQIIVTTAEFSFGSSVLTFYCEHYNIQHFNFQHGEKTFDIRDAFPRFSKFYVWDRHYIKLFKELRTGVKDEDFIIFVPEIIYSLSARESKTYTYYLQIHTKQELIKIKKFMDKLGKSYKIRPHPLYKQKELYEVFDPSYIENANVISIIESIASTKAAIAMDSTVLFQAHLMNREVVIDDISNPEYFLEIKKRKYIMIEKPHILFSELIASN